jgi:hypothetical protein
VEKQQILILQFFVDPTCVGTYEKTSRGEHVNHYTTNMVFETDAQLKFEVK